MSKNKNSEIPTIKERYNEFNNDLHNYLTTNNNFRNYQDNPKELTFDVMMDLKSVVSDVHNIVTLLTTLKFVELFKGEKDKVDNNPNAKGYDLVYPSNDNPVIIAEIKCNKPCGKNNFESNQIKAIKKDIENLKSEKNTSQILHEPDGDEKFIKAIKFMVLLEYTGVKDHMVKIKEKDDRIRIVKNEEVDTVINKNKYEDGNLVNPDCIHVVCIPPGDISISELLDNQAYT
ncbi:MAG: hypothetical protein IJK92_08975 [Bacteroidales bacterium]|nr:hypothetical protein [Bacteroidales bacterium]